MDRQTECCIDELRASLADKSIRTSGVLKFGTVTVLLSDAEMEAICSTADAAVLPQRAIAIRVLLLKQIESAKDTQGQDVANTASVARDVLSEAQRQLGSSRVGLRETLAFSARQLRTVLQSLDAGMSKGPSAKQDSASANLREGFFLHAPRVDPNSARREVDKLINQAVFELRYAFSSDEEIANELTDAVDRVIRHGHSW